MSSPAQTLKWCKVYSPQLQASQLRFGNQLRLSSQHLYCPCGEPLQSRDHIITACPTYENQRQVLTDASEDLVTSAPKKA
ncbi:hypothetical protein SCLCIDRAFT_1017788 [Scleroderma citrinum Foug A]|uniref:Uncharacterized protein n=1 Tax=Scleroderma citrinum Foug A TaxID=1036808 RepID=A0A0C3EK64_9AGAM|nr:hypothetical protein SCLCIDRAFT_1017788 [Scleroderma citrinum Foug A]